MGLFDKISETKQEAVAKIDFPVFVGEYPFDRTIVESKIVLSSNQSLIWDSLNVINYKEKIEGFGKLFNS
jgi:hypothetical protein